MGISNQVQNIGQGVKNSTKSMLILIMSFFLRLITGFFLGLTLGLMGQAIISFGTIGLVLTLIVCTTITKLS